MSTAFLLVAGHPALDLINTLDWRFRKDGAEELLKSYGDLVRFTEQSKLLTSRETRRLLRSASDEAGARTGEIGREAHIRHQKQQGIDPPRSAPDRVEQRHSCKQCQPFETEQRSQPSGHGARFCARDIGHVPVPRCGIGYILRPAGTPQACRSPGRAFPAGKMPC